MLKNMKRLAVWWKFTSGAAHMLIAGFAILATQHVIPLGDHTLAILIAWANVCTALHRGAGHIMEIHE